MTLALRTIKPIYHSSLASQIEQLRDMDRQLKRLEKQCAELKKTICEEMQSRGIEEAVNDLGGVIATCNLQSRSSFDRRSF